MMLAVMDLHRLSVDVGFHGVGSIRERCKRKCHSVSPGGIADAVVVQNEIV
jgi:hypothetical protein